MNETAASAAASATIPSFGTVPNLVGIEQSIAETLLADAGMALGTVTNAVTYSLTVPAGHVLSQSPVGPASSAYATAVNLEISIGQDPALPTLASVDIVDDQGGMHVTLPATITYTLTFSKDMDVSTIDAGDFFNLSGVPITIGAINEISPGVVTVEVTPNTIESGYLLLAIAQGAVIKDAQGNDLNTSEAIADENWIPLVRPNNYVPVVDAGADQTIAIDSAQPWSPTAIPTVAWFDATDATTISQSGGAVSQWRDKSGNGINASQGNTANQPTYRSSDARLNGLPSIGYDQGFKYLQTPTIAAIRNAYVVTYYDDPDNIFDSHRVLFSDTGNSFKLQGTGSNWVSGAGFDKFRDGSTTSSNANALPMGPTLWTAKGTASHTNRAWRILAGANGFQYWEYGAVGEVIFTDGTEDLATQQKIEGYLAHKWGLAANLPADHPHKSSAPTSLAAVANLDGTVVDYDNDPLTTVWSLVSGPAATNFANAAAVDTSATFTVAGTYVLKLTADDGIAQASDQVTITVEPGSDTTPPTLSGADIVDDRSGADVSENTSITYTVTFSKDMDAATVEASDFGNAGTAPITVGAVTKSSPGVFSVGVTPTATGSLRLQVNAGATLHDLTGNALDTSTAIVDDTTINVLAVSTNNAPVADEQSVSTNVDTAVAVTLTATDADGDTLTYTVVTAPTNGSLSGTAPNLTYTPNTGYSGNDSFAFVANDGLVNSNTATVSITVNSATPNNPPVVDAGLDQTVTLIAGGGAWTPAETTSVAWYDAADAATITQSSGAVSQWADKSGNNHHATQGNAANRPTYNSSDTRLGSQPTIGYDQGFKYLQTPTIASIRNVYVVTYYDDPNNLFDSHRVLFSDTGNANKLQGVQGGANWVSGAGFDKFRDGSSSSSNANALPMSPTLWTAKGTASHTNKAWRILSGANNFQYWEYGAVGEVILTDGTEDLATQQKIEGYLAHKWGLQANLPADHPYKSAAPGGGSSAQATLAGTISDPDGDPLTSNWSVVSGPGTVAFANATAVNTTADFDTIGSYVLRLTASDSVDQTSDDVTITVQDASTNIAPVADNQSVATNEDTAVAVTLTASDIDGDALSYTVVTAPLNGSLSGIAPNLTYTPNANYNGSDSFTFVANDSTLDSNIATVSITVYAVNDAPVANAQSVATDEDTAVAVTLTATDVDGDSLTYSVVTAPTSGTLSGIAPNLTYTPNADYNGSDSFTFVANDGLVNSNVATVSITINAVNDAPVADDQSVNADEDTAVAIILTASDVDGDTLTYSVVTAPINGTLSGIAPNLTYTPNADYNGSDSFTFVANDGLVDSNIATVSITVNAVNDAPVANAQSVATDEDTAVAIILTATDVDGDALTYSVMTAPINGTLSGIAPNLTYTPNADYNGSDSFTFVANDGTVDSNIATVSITVNAINDAPVFAVSPFSAPDATAEEAYSASIAGAASDVDGDPLTYTKVSGPAWLSITPGGGLSGTPSATDIGTNSFIVSASDGQLAAEASLVINVVQALAIVPDVVGLAQAAAASAITAADLAVGIITEEHSATVPAGDVISQGLTAGSSVPKGSGVDLVVSLGAASSAKLVRTTISAVSNTGWTTVNLGNTYHSPVIVATPIYPNSTLPPVVTRIRNVTTTGFDLRVARADGQTGPVSFNVSIVAIEEGVYTQAADGVTMEAVKFTSTLTAYSPNNWSAEARSFQNSYTSPVVIGQVMSANDPNWSAFWSMGSSRSNPVDVANFNVGKHVGQDTNLIRANETIGYIVIEAGNGSIDGIAYEAGLGAKIVQCFGDSSTPYIYPLSGNLNSIGTAAVSQSGMNGNDGSWAVLSGSPAITTTTLGLHVAEDAFKDNRRRHAAEHVGYIVFE